LRYFFLESFLLGPGELALQFQYLTLRSLSLSFRALSLPLSLLERARERLAFGERLPEREILGVEIGPQLRDIVLRTPREREREKEREGERGR
jgi:hypothetical protein